MRHSTTSTTRVLTIVSLVVLSALSFAVVYGTKNVADTQPQDPVFSFHKRNVPHHPRVIHHLRAASSDTPSPTPTSDSSSPTPSSSPPPSVSSKPPTATSASPSTSSTPTSSSTHSSTSSTEPTSTSKSSDTTSTTSSTSSQSSSTPSSTPSSSSSIAPSSSSNTSPTTSTTSSTSNLPIGGSTTTTPLAPNSPVTTGSFFVASNPTSTVFASSTAGATSKGFFANKAAVGATFGIIGVIGGIVVLIGAITVIRRYRRAYHDDDDDFYEKYPGAGGSGDRFSREPAELGLGPLGESVTDLTDAASPDAYPDRAIHYGRPDPSTVFRPVDYGIDYPPNADYAEQPVDTPGRNDFAYAYDNYDYDPNRPGSASSHPYADPANASRAVPAPPVTYPRQIPGRAQEMVTTDSYYGPNTAGVGVGLAQ